jgi:hypothetical protein
MGELRRMENEREVSGLETERTRERDMRGLETERRED